VCLMSCRPTLFSSPVQRMSFMSRVCAGTLDIITKHKSKSICVCVCVCVYGIVCVNVCVCVVCMCGVYVYVCMCVCVCVCLYGICAWCMCVFVSLVRIIFCLSLYDRTSLYHTPLSLHFQLPTAGSYEMCCVSLC